MVYLVNTLPADALAPLVARAGKVLAVKDMQHNRVFQLGIRSSSVEQNPRYITKPDYIFYNIQTIQYLKHW